MPEVRTSAVSVVTLDWVGLRIDLQNYYYTVYNDTDTIVFLL